MTWSDEVRGYSAGNGWYYRHRQDAGLNGGWTVVRFKVVNGLREHDRGYLSGIYENRHEAKEAAREAAEEEARNGQGG